MAAINVDLPPINREPAVRALVARLLSYEPGKPLAVSFRRLAKERSLDQNAALWGVAYPPLMEAMGLEGDREKNELHEFWCGEYFGWGERNYFGRRKLYPIRTTTRNEHGERDLISTLDMMAFYNFIQRRAAENGVEVPDPDPAMWQRMKEQEARHD